MGLLSVTEYAKKTGKDPGNIRRLLSAGRIDGIRIGNQWAIEETVPYPQDRRVKSGVYKGWRDRVGLFDSIRMARLIRNMIRDLETVYGNKLRRVVLYGSYARREQTEESDVDIALILKPGHTKKMNDKMIETVAAYELKCGRTLSVVDIDESRFNEWKSTLPYYKYIEDEGIELWTKN